MRRISEVLHTAGSRPTNLRLAPLCERPCASCDPQSCGLLNSRGKPGGQVSVTPVLAQISTQSVRLG